MAEYGEGYSTAEQDGDATDRPVAEERHDVAGGKKNSKDSESKQAKRRRSCPMYFGVKSYLHHFYDDGNSYKDPSLYEDDDSQYLLQPNYRRRRCTPIWWKIFMWIGVTLLLFGVIGILVGYLVPPRHVLITNTPSSASPSASLENEGGEPSGNNNKAYVDERAQEYNTTLDMSKLIGLILFSVGGVTLAMALLFPSFLTHHCLDEDFYENEGDLRDVTGGYSRHHHHRQGKHPGGGEGPPLLEQTTIPASAKVKEVQPSKKTGQQMLTHIPQAPSPTAARSSPDAPAPGPSTK